MGDDDHFWHRLTQPLEWYRLFVGDVSNDVSERTLDEAFGKYKTYCKCKVVRDHLSQKVSQHCTGCTIGRLRQAKYGFIAFTDPEDFLRAWKEMDGTFYRRSVVCAET